MLEIHTLLFSGYVVVLPDPFRGMGGAGTPRRPNSQATFQDLDQRSKMEEVVLKMACRERLECGTDKEEVSQILQRVSTGLQDPAESVHRSARSCRECPQACKILQRVSTGLQDPAESVHSPARSCRECPQPCKKNSPVLSCIGKRLEIVCYD